MQQAGQLFETYTRGVGLAGDIGTIVAVTHHAGSAVTPGTYYTYHNHRGDVIITRSATTTVGVYEYSAFGNLKSSIGNDVCRFKFSSKERDPSTGFYYYGYRFYSPQWQRWISRDPIGEEGGINLYGYVGNNPLRRIDLFGLMPPMPLPWPANPAHDPCISSGGHYEPYWKVMGYDSFGQCIHCEFYTPRDLTAGGCGTIIGGIIGAACGPLGALIGGTIGAVGGGMLIPAAICSMPICVYN